MEGEVDVLITEALKGEALERLKSRFRVHEEPELWRDEERLRRALSRARAVLVRNQTQLTKEILEGAPRLLVIGRAGAGLDNVDVKSASDLGIVVVYAPEENAISVAEHTFALILSLLRKIPQADRSVREGKWERLKFVGRELYGKILGVIGMGRIGFRVALRARAFGMQVLAFDPYVNPESPQITEAGAEMVDLEELLRRSDVVTLHLPLTEETRGLINYERLRRMKPTAILVNTSRGGVVVESDLCRALEERIIAGAALDVREEEPPPPSPLHEMENVVLTPHIAAFTEEAQERVMASVCRDVERVLRGEEAINFVNFPRPRREER